MILLLRCPGCGNTMRFSPQHMEGLQKKKKRCVYCGKTFSVFDHIIRRET